MSLIQKLFKFILPAKAFQKIEEESKRWFYECKCGHSKSVWDAGGLRAHAYPLKKPVLGYCPQCKKFTLLTTAKKM